MNKMFIKRILKEQRLPRRIGFMSLIIFVLSLCISCGGSNGGMPLVLPEKLPYNAAVVFSEGFDLAGEEHYSINEALHTELFNRVGDIYQNTAEEFEIPAKGEYDRIIKFTLNEAVRDEHRGRLANVTDPLLPSRYIPLRFRISVTMTSYDGENAELIHTEVIKGIGESSSQEGVSIREGAAVVSSAGRGSFDEAVAEAIEDVCNDVSRLLIRGFAEPKKESKTLQGRDEALAVEEV